MMTPEDVGLTAEEWAAPITKAGCLLLLALAKAVDSRVEATDAAALAWSLALGPGVRAGDAFQALVEWWRKGAEVNEHVPRLMPQHLNLIIDDWHDQHRMNNTGRPMPVGGPWAEGVKPPALAAGPPPKALDGQR